MIALERIEQRGPNNPAHTLAYEIEGDQLIVTHTDFEGVETTDSFDFSETPDGRIDIDSIETHLPVQPILDAERQGDTVNVRVLEWY